MFPLATYYEYNGSRASVVNYLTIFYGEEDDNRAPVVDYLTPVLNGPGNVKGILRMFFNARMYSRLLFVGDFNYEFYPEDDEVQMVTTYPLVVPKVLTCMSLRIIGQIVFNSTNADRLIDNFEYVVPF